MGKRKKASKPIAKKKQGALPVIFQCLFCNHEKSVVVKLEKKLGIGQLNCKVCGQSFQTGVNYLSAPIDVYYDWVDACERVAAEHKAEGGDDIEEDAPVQRRPIATGSPKAGAPRPRTGAGQATITSGSGYVDEDEDDGFVVEDDPVAAGDEFGDDDDDDL